MPKTSTFLLLAAALLAVVSAQPYALKNSAAVPILGGGPATTFQSFSTCTYNAQGNAICTQVSLSSATQQLPGFCPPTNSQCQSSITSAQQNPQPTGPTVTITGMIGVAYVQVNCNSPKYVTCAISTTVVYFLVGSDGNLYSLHDTPPTARLYTLVGRQVTVTGVLVTPSSWNPASTTPKLSFYGDLYVQSITPG